METWWFYEMPSAQAAFDAVFEVILNYSRDEVTGLGAVSREGTDERDHLYVFVCSKDPPGRSRASTSCSVITVAGRRSPTRSLWSPKASSSTDPATG
jgi:hypothetical protein